jgi:HK97 family phage portal protein
VATKTFYVQPQISGGLKSIPLHTTTPEMWREAHSALGVADDDLLKLYEGVAWFRRGVDVRAETLANLPWQFSRGDGESELDEGELPPLPFALDMDTLLNMVEAWLTLYGAAYAFKGLNAARIPKELRPMHPATVTPQYDPTNGLTGFKRRLPGGSEVTLSPDELAYVWLPPRKSEVGPGIPPARAALAAATLLKSADEFGLMYFENGVIAPALVTVPAGTPDAEKKRLEGWAQRAMGGLKKAFNVIGIAADVKVSSLGSAVPLGSLALPELTDKKREDIATAFGVPQTILFSNAANFATAQQDDLHFYDKTIIPEARRIERALNRQVFGPLGWRLTFKPERLEMYQAIEAEKGYKLSNLYQNGIVTVEEVRQQLGMSDRPSVGELLDPVLVFQRNSGSQSAGQGGAIRSLPPGQSAEQKAVADELARWERKALKRIEEGKPEKAREFESAALPWAVKAWVTSALEEARTAEDVKLAFAGVNIWEGYP